VGRASGVLLLSDVQLLLQNSLFFLSLENMSTRLSPCLRAFERLCRRSSGERISPSDSPHRQSFFPVYHIQEV
jgi:hypothetical protein